MVGAAEAEVGVSTVEPTVVLVGFDVGFFDTGFVVGFVDGLIVVFAIGFEVGFPDGLAVGVVAMTPFDFVVVGTADAV